MDRFFFLSSFDRYSSADPTHNISSTLRQEAISITRVRCKQRQSWFNTPQPHLSNKSSNKKKKALKFIDDCPIIFSRWNKCHSFFIIKNQYELYINKTFSRVCVWNLSIANDLFFCLITVLIKTKVWMFKHLRMTSCNWIPILLLLIIIIDRQWKRTKQSCHHCWRQTTHLIKV